MDAPSNSAAASSAVRFGKYTLIAKLDTGGMAEIFFARFEGVAGFEKPVVIKRILPELAEEERFVTMFLNEARLAARITHPNVCQVYDLGRIEGRYFMALEYLDGVPLTSLVRLVRTAPAAGELRLVAGLFLQACEGLHHAHEQRDFEGRPINLIHRDISPQNLFVTVDGIVKVLDFGVAKARTVSAKAISGNLKGKYAYMAPEQLRGQALDRRADIFALGVVLFAMLTGKHLFRRESELLTFKAITEEPIMRAQELRADLPREIDEAIVRALSRDREVRFPTARAFGEAVVRAVAPMGGPLSAPEISEHVRTLCGREIADRRTAISRGTAFVERGGDRMKTVPSRPSIVDPIPSRWRLGSGLLIGLIALGVVAILVAAVLLGIWKLSREPEGPHLNPERRAGTEPADPLRP
jgi:serine/threonine protein kinase